jgi:hypothetical protein
VLQARDAEPLQMTMPSLRADEMRLRMLGQSRDRVLRQGATPHGLERGGVDDVIAVAGAQQLEEVEPALRAGGGEEGKARVADLRAHAVRRPMSSTGVVDRDPPRRLQPGPQHRARLLDEALLACDQQPDQLALGNRDADRSQLLDQSRHGDLPLISARSAAAPARSVH